MGELRVQAVLQLQPQDPQHLVSAAYLAADDGAQVTMDHLLHGTRRELQKMGPWRRKRTWS